MAETSPEDQPAVAILPYGVKPGLRTARMPLSELIWPLGRPERLAEGTLAALSPEDHLVCFPSTAAWFSPRPGFRARLSVLIVEPEALHRRHMIRGRLMHRRFHRLLSCNAWFLASVPNGKFFPFGSTWVPEWRDLDLTKSRNLSLIASAKRDLEGHRLRHACAEWLIASGADADIMGRGYRPFEAKAEGLAPYRYSVVVENVREPSYFTEKLVDALLCRTVPIYWGAPDIDRFFDPAGMLLCESLQDVQAAVARIGPEDYELRAEALARNQMRAAEYADPYERAARAVLERT